MILLLLFSALSFSLKKVCICNYAFSNNCPADGVKHLIDNTYNIHRFLKYFLEGDNELELYFYSSYDDFTFLIDIGLFAGKSVTFKKVSDTKRIDIELWTEAGSVKGSKFVLDAGMTVRCPTAVGKNVIFDHVTLKDPKITFFNNDSPVLQAGTIEMENLNSINFFSKYVVDGSDSDDSYKGFVVDLSKESTNKVEVSEKKFSFDLQSKAINVEFLNSDKLRSSITASSKEYVIDFIGGTTIPNIELVNMKKCTFNGNFPTTAVFPIKGTGSNAPALIANDKVMPISLPSNFAQSTLTFNQNEAKVTGNIECPITVSLANIGNAQRAPIEFLGSFSGKSVDLSYSWIDATFSNFQPTNTAGSVFPITFYIGLGGISTVKIIKSNLESTTMNNVKLNNDFTDIIPDSQLTNLISQENWTLLESDFTFTPTPVLEMQSNKYLHGFMKNDECVKISTFSKNGRNFITGKVSPPASIPVKVCVASAAASCTASDGTFSSFNEITSKFFINIYKKLALNLKNDDYTIDLKYIDGTYSDVEVVVNGANSGSKTKINGFSYSSPSSANSKNLILEGTPGISYIRFESISLPTTTINIPTIEFVSCEAQSSDVNISVQEKCSVYTDMSSFSKLSTNIGTSTSILSVTDISADEIEVSNDGFLVKQKDDSLTTATLPIKENVILMLSPNSPNNLALILSSVDKKPPTFSIDLNNENHPFVLSLANWMKAEEYNYKITVKHGKSDISISPNDGFANEKGRFVFEGTGKVTFPSKPKEGLPKLTIILIGIAAAVVVVVVAIVVVGVVLVKRKKAKQQAGENNIANKTLFELNDLV